MQPMTLLQRYTSILRSEEKKDENESGRKIPTGFEKILKRVKRGTSSTKSNKEESLNTENEKKDEDKQMNEEKAEKSDNEEEPK